MQQAELITEPIWYSVESERVPLYFAVGPMESASAIARLILRGPVNSKHKLQQVEKPEKLLFSHQMSGVQVFIRGSL